MVCIVYALSVHQSLQTVSYYYYYYYYYYAAYNGYLLLVTSEHSHLLHLFLQSLVYTTTGNVVIMCDLHVLISMIPYLIWVYIVLSSLEILCGHLLCYLVYHHRPLCVTLTDSSPCITSSLCTGSSFCTPTISHTVTIPSITVNEVHTHTHTHTHVLACSTVDRGGGGSRYKLPGPHIYSQQQGPPCPVSKTLVQ